MDTNPTFLSDRLDNIPTVVNNNNNVAEPSDRYFIFNKIQILIKETRIPICYKFSVRSVGGPTVWGFVINMNIRKIVSLQ